MHFILKLQKSLYPAFNNTLSFGRHIQNVTVKAASSLYDLQTLKARILQNKALWGMS